MTSSSPAPPARPSDDARARRTNRWRIAAWSVAALLLLVPWIGTQVSDEVHWTRYDFAFAALLLLGIGIPLELVVRTTGNATYRWAVGVALGTAFVLVWINGAIGIIGAEDADVNVLYGGVVAIAVIGALVTRARPRGMAWTMAATALAQATVALGALVAGLAPTGGGAPAFVVGVNAGFVALWLGSAALFRQAADRQHAAE